MHVSILFHVFVNIFRPVANNKIKLHVYGITLYLIKGKLVWSPLYSIGFTNILWRYFKVQSILV